MRRAQNRGVQAIREDYGADVQTAEAVYGSSCKPRF